MKIKIRGSFETEIYRNPFGEVVIFQCIDHEDTRVFLTLNQARELHAYLGDALDSPEFWEADDDAETEPKA